MSTHRADGATGRRARPPRRRRRLAWASAVSLTVATAVAATLVTHGGGDLPGVAGVVGAATGAVNSDAGSGLPAVGTLGATEQVAVVTTDNGVKRVTGDDRVATAIAVSRDRFPSGFPTAVLASADDFADALAGSALADAVGAPLLLSGRAGLDPRVAAELRDHLAKGGSVYVLGGPKALAPATDDAVTASGGEPVRLAGKDRYATAAVIASQVAEESPTGQCDALLVTGQSFPDGAAASGVVTAHRPLLYTMGDAMPFATRAALAACTKAGSTATAVGGPAAKAAQSADLPAGVELESVVGKDRFETSAKLMQLAVSGEQAAAAKVETTRDAEAGDASELADDDAPADGGQAPAAASPSASASSSSSPSSSASASASDPGQQDAQYAASVRADASTGPVVLASGADYADALVGGTYHRPVLLTEASTLPDSVADAIHAASSDVRGVLVVGGQRAVSDVTADDAAQIASGVAPAAVKAKRPAASPSASATASPSSSASPSTSSAGTPSASAPAGAPAGAGGGGGGAITGAGAGQWFSGASGTGVSDGSFAKWRGSDLGIVGTWSDNNSAMVEAWAMQPGQEFGSWQGNIDIAVGAIGGGETWQAASTGAYDARWRQSLTKMKTLWGNKPGTVYIRFAHEMNGNWYDWSVNSGNKDAFVASWKRYRALQQEIFPKSKLVFSVNRESVNSGFNWTQSFPGKQYVDVLGVDYYNQYPYAANLQDFNGALGAKDGYGAPKGLQAHLDFARSVGLPLSVNEWSGISENGDSPGFIQGMHDFFAKNAGSGPGQLLYEVQFNCDMGGGKFMLYKGGNMPQSAAMYQKLF
ncbi:cell wall-binding repeat-containing protein [Quadrisphaera oryzae]|uniref:cell wall-binding repeat-containing protein n=1 Tax=Quadrisphaera TaxID=317661 RepID=UPI0016488DE3|nr:cell wall-binding repeat-containing protein [Quadrisphaera sp. RL12-1S]MBC3761623.1 cell wall-binding repeat-containing protein [Quadrisphaera sp. RL12-1S]